jgi:hypothetical protein
MTTRLASLAWRIQVKTILALGVILIVTLCHADEQPPSRLPRTNLLVYHNRKGEVLPVKSKSDWLKRRAEIIRGFESVAGPFPGRGKLCDLDVQTIESHDAGKYERRSITYQSELGSRVPAYLLIPKSAFSGKAKLQAMLALHPTDMQFGHRVTVEKLREDYRMYAHDLAELDLVVLAPAYPLMANYQPDLKSLGYQSGTMKAIWDNKRGLDLLDSLPFVEHKRYGALGHSLGGHNAIYTAVFDERIKVVISSCGFDSFLDYYGGDPKNWQPERGWCQTRYMPRLADYRGRLTEIPFDFHELIGAIAPRAVWINAPLRDSNFKSQSVDEIVNAAKPIFELYKSESKLAVAHPDCGHDFPEEFRRVLYRMLSTEKFPK